MPQVPDGNGGYPPFGESPASPTEPHPGDDGRFLAHVTITLTKLAARACGPSTIRELVKALERKADKMDLAAIDPEEEYDIW